MEHTLTRIIAFLLVLLLLPTPFAGSVVAADTVKENVIEKKTLPNELIYFILTDRYANGDSGNDGDEYDPDNPLKRHGGDFRGVIDHLDEIQNLGTTMIWLTPVQKNTTDGYHGYWIDDFYAIDPHLGTAEELRELCDEAHARGMKVMLDFVVNHTGVGSSLFKEREKDGWFHPDKTIRNMKKKSEREKGWLAGLPDLDQERPDVRDYLIDSALWLIEKSGCDAFRLDTVVHVPLEFWSEFREAILSEYPDFFMIGEVYNYQSKTLKYYQSGTGIDGFLNYPLYDGIQSAFRQHGNTDNLKRKIAEDQELTFTEYNGIFFDNHDNVRFFTSQGANAEAYYLQGLAFVMSYSGIPVVYYGSEYAAEGGEDPDNRRMMDFDRENPEVLRLWHTMLDLRENENFLTGERSILESDNTTLLYHITSEEKSWLLAYHIADENKEVELTSNPQSIDLLEIFGNEDGTKAEVTSGIMYLPAHSLSIWEISSSK